MENLEGLFDCHTHTGYSFDADVPVEQMMEQAQRLGLAVYCVTDHCEMNDADLTDLERCMKESVASVSQLRAGRFKNSRTQFLTGLELGQATQNLAEAERFLKEIPVDFVIGSLHNLSGEQDFYYLNYTSENIVPYLKRYFDELYELVCRGDFDSLGHLTYPLRYMSASLGKTPDLSPFRDKIDQILSGLIKRDKALEINTSGLRDKIGETLPPFSIIRRFYELGGKYITVGSDAHNMGAVGQGAAEAVRLVKQAGFSGITAYIKRRPVVFPFPSALR